MKKLLVLLLISTATFSQSIKVRGVTLSYDKTNLTMTLTIPQSLVILSNQDEQMRIIIDKEYRGLQLGKNLINRLVSFGLNDWKCYKVILNCLDHNIKFYEKCGFQVTGAELKYMGGTYGSPHTPPPSTR